MATTLEFTNYVMEQLESDWEVTCRKMFGEYMVYVNQKPVILICDNIPYVRKWDNIHHLMVDAEVGFPYHGAKEHYILDVDDRDFSLKVIKEVEKVALIPKKKPKKV